MFITLVGIVYIPDFPTGHCSKVSMFLSNNTPSSDEYDVTLSGIIMLVKSAQPANARLPIFIVLSGIMILAKFWQLANALSPISITFFEIFTFFKLLQ